MSKRPEEVVLVDKFHVRLGVHKENQIIREKSTVKLVQRADGGGIRGNGLLKSTWQTRRGYTKN